MSSFLDEVAVILGAQAALSETDREIIEAMIDIGTEKSEIAATFGYAPAQVEAVAEEQAKSSSTKAVRTDR
jgi:hypothetical protein